MQEKKQKPKVRFTRNEDGSIGVPRDTARQTDELVDVWSQQQAIPKTSIKEDVHHVRSVFAKRNEKRKAKKLQKSTTKTTAKKSVTIGLPDLESFKKYIPKTKKQRIVSISAGVVLLLVLTGVSGVFSGGNNDTSQNSGEVQGAIKTQVTPEFPTLTPLGAGVEDLGGFAKISPDSAPSVYAFRDVIGGTSIRVSQQQIPDNLRSDQTAKLKELAEGFNAKEVLEVGDNTAYIGTSVNGVQSVVYIKGENLVLIASDSIIPNSEWVTYIGNLRF